MADTRGYQRKKDNKIEYVILHSLIATSCTVYLRGRIAISLLALEARV